MTKDDQPKTAHQFNTPLIGHAEAAETIQVKRDMDRRRKIYDALAAIVPDRELRRAIVARVMDVD